MKAARLMKLQVIAIPPDLSVESAHGLMQRLGVRHLPVLAGKKLVGILSDRDVLLAIGRRDDGTYSYPKTAAGQLMSLAPVSATTRASIEEIAKTMVDAKIDAVPIVDPDGELIGLVTSTDLMKLLAEPPGAMPLKMSFEIRRASDLPAQA